MGLSRAFLSAAACMAAPIEHRWLSIVLILTTMMYGARAVDFQFEGRENLDFFLTQCEVTASSWRRDRLPLNHPVQWRSIGRRHSGALCRAKSIHGASGTVGCTVWRPFLLYT